MGNITICGIRVCCRKDYRQPKDKKIYFEDFDGVYEPNVNNETDSENDEVALNSEIENTFYFKNAFFLNAQYLYQSMGLSCDKAAMLARDLSSIYYDTKTGRLKDESEWQFDRPCIAFLDGKIHVCDI